MPVMSSGGLDAESVPTDDSKPDTQSIESASRLECRGCAFEPEDSVVPPERCPKCGGSAWVRQPVQGNANKVADRHP